MRNARAVLDGLESNVYTNMGKFSVVFSRRILFSLETERATLVKNDEHRQKLANAINPSCLSLWFGVVYCQTVKRKLRKITEILERHSQWDPSRITTYRVARIETYTDFERENPRRKVNFKNFRVASEASTVHHTSCGQAPILDHSLACTQAFYPTDPSPSSPQLQALVFSQIFVLLSQLGCSNIRRLPRHVTYLRTLPCASGMEV